MQESITLTIIEDPSDILRNPRTKDRLFTALQSVLIEKGIIASIDVTESTGEEDTGSEREIPSE